MPLFIGFKEAIEPALKKIMPQITSTKQQSGRGYSHKKRGKSVIFMKLPLLLTYDRRLTRGPSRSSREGPS